MSEQEDSKQNVDAESIGVNTDELSPEELQQLVDNNPELQDEVSVSNMDHEVKDNSISQKNKVFITNEVQREELINELTEKNKILDLLVKSNNDLKNKIEVSNAKYKEIVEKVKEKESEKSESKLTLQIKELEKEISANNAETERYKKQIDQLKNKIEFKMNLERAFNWQNLYKQENMKNIDWKNQLNSLWRVNGVQLKYINNYDKENQITEKLDILKNEIKQTKDTIKEYQEKYTKQDRFIRLVHEKILSLEMMIKKMKEPKLEKTKLFTREELKDTLEWLTNWKNQIKDNRNQLNSLTKANDDKMHQLLAQNKQIENDFKENEKTNKMLIFKKNELKRSIKNTNFTMTNKKLKKTINVNKIPKKYNEIAMKKVEEEDDNMMNYDNMNSNTDNKEPTQKLFSKNPNKDTMNNINEQLNDNDDQGNDINNRMGDEEEDNAQGQSNDSNLPINNNQVANEEDYDNQNNMEDSNNQ